MSFALEAKILWTWTSVLTPKGKFIEFHDIRLLFLEWN